jgi:hypothetical protein
MLLLSRAAKDAVGSYLAEYAEILPLECDDGEFWVANVTRLVDCLDESASQLLRDPDTGAILVVQKHVFRPIDLECAGIFKLSQMPRGLIYVTEPFVDVVNSSGLSGLVFGQVWPPRSS